MESFVDVVGAFSLRIFIGRLVRVNSIVGDNVSPLGFDDHISIVLPRDHQSLVVHASCLGEGRRH